MPPRSRPPAARGADRAPRSAGPGWAASGSASAARRVPLRLRPQDDDLRRGGEHATHQALRPLAPRADVRSVVVVVDVQDVRQRHRAGDGREHQLARGAAAAGDVHVKQAGSAGNPRPRDSERRGHKVEGG